MKKRTILWGLMLTAALLILAIFSGNDVLRYFESSAPSESVGSITDGELINGKRLPSAGQNFVTYSRLGSLIGRTCVHGKVREAMLDAYDAMADRMPEVEFTYGEGSWCWGGGRIRPHRTHQNGLSVDFMVPVVDDGGEPASFPAWPWTKFGYNVEFDEAGRGDGLRVDFDALAAHLLALDDAAGEAGLEVRRVIFAPNLRDELFSSESGEAVRRRLSFMQGAAWVRHDEHYHVDFVVSQPGSAD